MIKKKDTSIVLAIALVIISRFPLTKYPIGWDSYFIQSLSTAIVKDGYMKWILSPLSFIGFTDYSYSSAEPLVLSIISVLSSSNLFIITLIFSIMVAIIGFFSTYILSKEIINDDRIALFAALAFSFAPLFFYFSNWYVSTRGLFAALFPLLLYSIIKLFRNINLKNLILFSIVLVIIVSTHKMFLFVALLIPAIILTWLIHKKEIHFNNNQFVLIISSLFLFCTILPFSGITPYNYAWWQYESRGIFSGSHILITLVNIGINYLDRIGPIFLLAIVGAFIYLRKNSDERNIKLTFILISPIILLLGFPLGQYLIFLLLPFISILGSFGFFFMMDKAPIKVVKPITTLVVISFVISSVFMFNYWIKKYDDRGDGLDIGDQTFQFTHYLSNELDGTLLFDNTYISVRTHTYTSQKSLPLRPPQLIYLGLATPNETTVDELTIEHILRYRTLGNTYPLSDYDHLSYLNYQNPEAKAIITKYDLTYFISDYNCAYGGVCFTAPSNIFFNSMKTKKNRIYSNEIEAVYEIK